MNSTSLDLESDYTITIVNLTAVKASLEFRRLKVRVHKGNNSELLDDLNDMINMLKLSIEFTKRLRKEHREIQKDLSKKDHDIVELTKEVNDLRQIKSNIENEL
jgi:hypothetical protein